MNQLQPTEGIHAYQHLVSLRRRIDEDGQIVQGQRAHRQRFNGTVADPDHSGRRVDLAAAVGGQPQPFRDWLRDGYAGGTRVQQQLHRLAVDGTLQTIMAAGIRLEQQIAISGDGRLLASMKIEGQQAQQREPGQQPETACHRVHRMSHIARVNGSA